MLLYRRFTKRTSNWSPKYKEYELISDTPGDEVEMERMALTQLGKIEDAMEKFGFKSIQQLITSMKVYYYGSRYKNKKN